MTHTTTALCACCRCRADTAPTGPNVFSISEAEFNQYFQGGQWTITLTQSSTETRYAGDRIEGSSGGTSSQEAAGCSHNINATFSGSITYTDSNGESSTTPFWTGVTLEVQFYKVWTGASFSFYMKVHLFVAGNAGSTPPLTSGSPPPHSVSLTVEGNTIPAYGNWGGNAPGWVGSPGYINTSSSTCTASFSAL